MFKILSLLSILLSLLPHSTTGGKVSGKEFKDKFLDTKSVGKTFTYETQQNGEVTTKAMSLFLQEKQYYLVLSDSFK